MITKEEQNQIIKDAWVRNLQKQDNIPEDVGTIYRNWVLGKIKEAGTQLVQTQGPVEQQAPGPGAEQQPPEQQQEAS